MKTWRIHLVWAAVTVVSCAAWSQRAVRSRDVEFLEREKVLQVKISEARKIPVLIAAEAATATVAPVVPIAAIPAPEQPAFEYEFQQEEKNDRPTVEELRRLLEGDPNDYWRAYSVISKMVPCPLKTDLVRVLFRHKDPQVRRSSIHLLQQALGPDAVAPLFQESLRIDPDVEVRESVAFQLGTHGAPGTIEALLQAFQKDELRIQVACASGLFDLGQAGPAAQLAPRIAARMDSPDGAVRREAVDLLSQFRGPQALPTLTRALGDSNGDVRLSAVNALYNSEDPQALPLLEPLLSDPVAAVRDAVKTLIEELKSRKQ